VIFLRWLFARIAGAIVGQTLASLRQMFTLWLATRRARAEGAADQRARDAERARRAEQEMSAILAGRRPTEETGRRLDEGSF
jgi:hypothetical protein